MVAHGAESRRLDCGHAELLLNHLLPRRVAGLCDRCTRLPARFAGHAAREARALADQLVPGPHAVDVDCVCGCAGRTKLSRSWLKQLKVRRPDLYDIAQSLAGNGDGTPPRPHDVSWDRVEPSQSRCTRLSLTGLAKTGRTTAEAELEGILEERRDKKERKKAKKRARKEAKKDTRT